MLYWIKSEINNDPELLAPYLIKIDQIPENNGQTESTLFDYIPDDTTSSYIDVRASAKNIYDTIDHDLLFEIIEYYTDYCDGDGMSYIVHGVLEECTDIPLLVGKNYNTEEHFVLMPSYYPWEVNQNKSLQNIHSDNDIEAIFADYLSKLTDQSLEDLDWGEQTLEGWG